MSRQQEGSGEQSQAEKKSTTTGLENKIPLTRRPQETVFEAATPRILPSELVAPTSQTEKETDGSGKAKGQGLPQRASPDVEVTSTGTITSVDIPEPENSDPTSNFGFSDGALDAIRNELKAMPVAAAICLFTLQLLGVLGAFHLTIDQIFLRSAAEISLGLDILVFWTAIWCLTSAWVGYPLAKALKLENAVKFGLSSGVPLYGPIVIFKLAKTAKSIVLRY